MFFKRTKIKFFVAIIFIFLIATSAAADITPEERDVQINNIQKEREQIYKDYKIKLDEFNNELKQKIFDADKIPDLNEKKEVRTQIFKEINFKRSDARKALNSRAWDLNLIEKDLKAGGSGDLEALHRQTKQRAVPPDFKERNQKLNELLQNKTIKENKVEESDPSSDEYTPKIDVSPEPPTSSPQTTTSAEDFFDWTKSKK